MPDKKVRLSTIENMCTALDEVEPIKRGQAEHYRQQALAYLTLYICELEILGIKTIKIKSPAADQSTQDK